MNFNRMLLNVAGHCVCLMALFLILYFSIQTDLLAQNTSKIRDNSEKQLEIIEGLDVYGGAVKTILSNYLENVVVDSLIKNSIEGLLTQLDPYAEYFSETVSNELNIITHGKYFGCGFGFKLINNQIVLINVRPGTPAHKAGLLVGDAIYSINSDTIKELTDIEGILSDIADEDIELEVMRPGRQDTFEIVFNKDTIDINAITYSDILQNDVGYIKLENFTAKAHSEFENSFYDLQKKKYLKGLIIDLRGNSGGILQEALKICNMFVPQDETLLTTKGRSYNNVFKARLRPIDTTLPLAVLIDAESASASEIVAGCLQDLDRAIILGNTSFGKGLVQEIFNLSNNHFLKLTTAKYYTPSGRCIQKVDYSINSQKDNTQKASNISQNLDSIDTFHTSAGRDVQQQNGIEPDVFVPSDTLKNYYSKLFINSYVLFDFINYWVNTSWYANDSAHYYNFRQQATLENFAITDSIYMDFVDFATDWKNIKKINTFAKLDSLKNSEPSEASKQIINNTINDLLLDYRRNLLQTDCKTELLTCLEYRIKHRLLDNTSYITTTIPRDKTIQTAIQQVSQTLRASP